MSSILVWLIVVLTIVCNSGQADKEVSLITPESTKQLEWHFKCPIVKVKFIGKAVLYYSNADSTFNIVQCGDVQQLPVLTMMPLQLHPEQPRIQQGREFSMIGLNSLPSTMFTDVSVLQCGRLSMNSRYLPNSQQRGEEKVARSAQLPGPMLLYAPKKEVCH